MSNNSSQSIKVNTLKRKEPTSACTSREMTRRKTSETIQKNSHDDDFFADCRLKELTYYGKSLFFGAKSTELLETLPVLFAHLSIGKFSNEIEAYIKILDSRDQISDADRELLFALMRKFMDLPPSATSSAQRSIFNFLEKVAPVEKIMACNVNFKRACSIGMKYIGTIREFARLSNEILRIRPFCGPFKHFQFTRIAAINKAYETRDHRFMICPRARSGYCTYNCTKRDMFFGGPAPDRQLQARSFAILCDDEAIQTVPSFAKKIPLRLVSGMEVKRESCLGVPNRLRDYAIVFSGTSLHPYVVADILVYHLLPLWLRKLCRPEFWDQERGRIADMVCDMRKKLARSA